MNTEEKFKKWALLAEAKGVKISVKSRGASSSFYIANVEKDGTKFGWLCESRAAAMHKAIEEFEKEMSTTKEAPEVVNKYNSKKVVSHSEHVSTMFPKSDFCMKYGILLKPSKRGGMLIRFIHRKAVDVDSFYSGKFCRVISQRPLEDFEYKEHLERYGQKGFDLFPSAFTYLEEIKSIDKVSKSFTPKGFENECFKLGHIEQKKLF